MSVAPVERNPLGLPRGSVRAILAIVITLMFWAYLVYTPASGTIIKVPSYMYCLAILVFVFFAAHRSTIGPDAAHAHSPLYLPRATLRFAILGGTIAITVWQLIVNPDVLLNKLTPTDDQMKGWPYLIFSLIGGFTVGWLFSHGPWKKSAWYQDLQAWLSLVALTFMLVNLFIDLIAKAAAHSSDFLLWDCVVIAILSLYYGARS
jgi:hypothetical protein